MLALVLAVLPQAAAADPVPTTFSATTHGDILDLSTSLAGLSFVGAGLGHAATQVDSTDSPRSTARSSNLAASVAGLPLDPTAVSQNAPPDNAAPTTQAVPSVNVLGILGLGLVEGSAHARWTDGGDNYCLPAEDNLTAASTSLAGVELGIPGVDILEVGVSETSGETQLVPTGGDNDARAVVSTSSGSVASLGLLNNVIEVAVSGDAEVTASASGVPGGAEASYTPPTVTVTAPVIGTQVLTPGASVTANVPLVGSATISMGEATIVESPDGQSASASVSMLSVELSLLGGLGSVDLDLVPLEAAATAPEGGVECALTAPTITAPEEGDVTGSQPPIAGTGVAGATITIEDEDQGVLGTIVVDGDGTWALVPDTPLDDGEHSITASQVLGGSESGPSDPVSFVVDTVAPDAPVVTSPVDGAVVGDATPDIGGTGEPGATVEVAVDGELVGSAVVDADGGWSVTPNSPLSEGEHTVVAAQTDAAGNESDPSVPVSFVVDTVAPDAPVVTSPVDGEVVGDATPDIGGTGEPGATVEVAVDGELVGSAVVDADGEWSVTPNSPLSEGEHTVVAVQTDAAGNESDPSVPIVFVVDTSGDPGDNGSGPGGPDGSTGGQPGGGSWAGVPPTSGGAGPSATAGYGSSRLPRTGAPLEVPDMALIALTLLGLGATLTVSARRRQRS